MWFGRVADQAHRLARDGQAAFDFGADRNVFDECAERIDEKLAAEIDAIVDYLYTL